MKNLLESTQLTSSEFKKAKKLDGFKKENYRYDRNFRIYQKINLLINNDMNKNQSNSESGTGKTVPVTAKGKTAPTPKAEEKRTYEGKDAVKKAEVAEKADAKTKLKLEKAEAKQQIADDKAKAKVVAKEAKIALKAKAKADAKKNKKPGVIVSIYEFLGKRPQTTAKLAERLFARFPKKTIKSLTGTINCQIGSEKGREKRLKTIGYKVEMTVKGTGKEKIKSFTGVKIVK